MNNETGRKWFVIDGETELLPQAPINVACHEWTEYRDEDGELWYVNDDGMELSAEEFGPIPDGDRFCALCGQTEYHARDCDAVNPTALAMIGKEARVIKYKD